LHINQNFSTNNHHLYCFRLFPIQATKKLKAFADFDDDELDMDNDSNDSDEDDVSDFDEDDLDPDKIEVPGTHRNERTLRNQN
jgi:hypothetical protein